LLMVRIDERGERVGGIGNAFHLYVHIYDVCLLLPRTFERWRRKDKRFNQQGLKRIGRYSDDEKCGKVRNFTQPRRRRPFSIPHIEIKVNDIRIQRLVWRVAVHALTIYLSLSVSCDHPSESKPTPLNRPCNQERPRKHENEPPPIKRKGSTMSLRSIPESLFLQRQKLLCGQAT
jgi:hypothetical protein